MIAQMEWSKAINVTKMDVSRCVQMAPYIIAVPKHAIRVMTRILYAGVSAAPKDIVKTMANVVHLIDIVPTLPIQPKRNVVAGVAYA